MRRPNDFQASADRITPTTFEDKALMLFHVEKHQIFLGRELETRIAADKPFSISGLIGGLCAETNGVF